MMTDDPTTAAATNPPPAPEPRPALRLAFLLGACVLGIVLFEELVEEVFEEPVEAFDLGVLELLQSWQTPLLDTLFATAAWLGNPAPFVTIALATLAVLIWRRQALLAATLISTVGGAYLLNALLKSLDRPRPTLIPHAVEATGMSFPSGHAMTSLCFYGFLMYLVLSPKPRQGWQWAVAAVLLVWVLCIGGSRLWFAVHYPTDVLAGWTVGAAWLAANLGVIEAARLRRRRLAGIDLR